MDAATRPLHVVRRSWTWGGALLIAGVLVGFLPTALRGGILWSAGTIGTALLAAAWLCFAYGRDRVVSRAAGVVALTVLALWPILALIAWPVLLPTEDAPTQAMVVIGTISALVPAAAAVVAAVEVARGDRVERRLRRVPLIAAALCILPPVALQVAFTAGGSMQPDQALLTALTSIVSLCQLIALIGLGVLAIVASLQARPAPASVPVFPSHEP